MTTTWGPGGGTHRRGERNRARPANSRAHAPCGDHGNLGVSVRPRKPPARAHGAFRPGPSPDLKPLTKKKNLSGGQDRPLMSRDGEIWRVRGIAEIGLDLKHHHSRPAAPPVPRPKQALSAQCQCLLNQLALMPSIKTLSRLPPLSPSGYLRFGCSARQFLFPHDPRGLPRVHEGRRLLLKLSSCHCSNSCSNSCYLKRGCSE